MYYPNFPHFQTPLASTATSSASNSQSASSVLQSTNPSALLLAAMSDLCPVYAPFFSAMVGHCTAELVPSFTLQIRAALVQSCSLVSLIPSPLQFGQNMVLNDGCVC